MSIVAALKLVDLRPDIDPVDGTVCVHGHRDARSLGASSADFAALELALRLGDQWNRDVVAVTAGPSEAKPLLREARAMGAARAVRIELPTGGPHGSAASATVAAALASVLGPDGSEPAELVLCGSASVDRGSGSVPAFLAEELDAAQALGLMELESSIPDEIRAVRRLDGGRRERLRVAAPAVLSVEAGVRVGGDRVAPRRASFTALLDTAEVTTALAPAPRDGFSGFPHRSGPFRARPRALPSPDPSRSARERALTILGTYTAHSPARIVHTDPDAAAAELLAYLRQHGFLSPS
ncbi:mycofactocin-associated electron transfer flavoprotein beta subunit [Lipingzhangella sp. LS1_29]|uniref:Mycofactocin-associated electron transfer flavoprotein beta subunit n=1 Tax=Lipingzhangella rawalii TaxID=2055835 RepID=A0ABU2HBI9_9ACTN|nr:mycofactocin-associated electron transfer flavoprotein beta subunit [Lipingzhangella rawalii]MDS1272682.1 mycofactocin-associated electron transfer flavoprotein beta subunit [Lipingzhangella rawalii]